MVKKKVNAIKSYHRTHKHNKNHSMKCFRLFLHFDKTGEFRHRRRIRRPKNVTIQQEEETLVRVPQISNSRLRVATRIIETIVFKILQDERLYRYNFTGVQKFSVLCEWQKCKYLATYAIHWSKAFIHVIQNS